MGGGETSQYFRYGGGGVYNPAYMYVLNKLCRCKWKRARACTPASKDQNLWYQLICDHGTADLCARVQLEIGYVTWFLDSL